MYGQEEAQYAFQKQSAFGAVPGSPDLTLIPREASFNITHGRNKLENPQVFADGRKRKFALGNHTTQASGSVVPNLSYVGHQLRALCGPPVTTGVGPYTHVFRPTVGAVMLYLMEKGIAGSALWKRYLNMVMRSLSLDQPIEGICTVGEDWVGSGDKTNEVATFDATPTEILGNPGEYADIALTEDAGATADILRLTVNAEKAIKEKRVHNGAGKATEMRCGGLAVSGTVEAFYESEARATKAAAKTLAAIKSILTSGADSLETLIPEAQFEISDWSTTDDGIVITHNFDGVYSGSADSPIKWTLINGVASYA